MLVWLENAYSRPFLGSFWGTFPPNDVTYRPNPKKDHPWAEPRHFSYKPRNRSRGSSWACEREKNRTGQDKTGKKSQKGYISPICAEVILINVKKLNSLKRLVRTTVDMSHN